MTAWAFKIRGVGGVTGGSSALYKEYKSDPSPDHSGTSDDKVDHIKPEIHFSIAAFLHFIGVVLLFFSSSDIVGGRRFIGVVLLLIGGFLILASCLMVFAWALSLGNAWFVL